MDGSSYIDLSNMHIDVYTESMICKRTSSGRVGSAETTEARALEHSLHHDLRQVL